MIATTDTDQIVEDTDHIVSNEIGLFDAAALEEVLVDDYVATPPIEDADRVTSEIKSPLHEVQHSRAAAADSPLLTDARKTPPDDDRDLIRLSPVATALLSSPSHRTSRGVVITKSENPIPSSPFVAPSDPVDGGGTAKSREAKARPTRRVSTSKPKENIAADPKTEQTNVYSGRSTRSKSTASNKKQGAVDEKTVQVKETAAGEVRSNQSNSGVTKRSTRRTASTKAADVVETADNPSGDVNEFISEADTGPRLSVGRAREVVVNIGTRKIAAPVPPSTRQDTNPAQDSASTMQLPTASQQLPPKAQNATNRSGKKCTCCFREKTLMWFTDGDRAKPSRASKMREPESDLTEEEEQVEPFKPAVKPEAIQPAVVQNTASAKARAPFRPPGARPGPGTTLAESINKGTTQLVGVLEAASPPKSPVRLMHITEFS